MESRQIFWMLVFSLQEQVYLEGADGTPHPHVVTNRMVRRGVADLHGKDTFDLVMELETRCKAEYDVPNGAVLTDVTILPNQL